MPFNHREIFYSERAAPFIRDFGGKMGGLKYLQTHVPELRNHILPMQIIPHGENFYGFKIDPGPDGRYLFRSSHHNDFAGLVDVLPTEIWTPERDSWNLTRITQGRPFMIDEVINYGRYENPDFDGRAHTGIQPYYPDHRGSIVEHPNRPGQYFVSFVDDGYSFGNVGDGIYTGVYQEKSGVFDRLSGDADRFKGDLPDQAKRLYELYKIVEYSGLVIPNVSFQMEFLNPDDKLYIAQVRAFKKKQQAGFELDAPERILFGVTPPDGIVLPVLVSSNGYDTMNRPLSSNEPWAYFKPAEERPYGMENLSLFRRQPSEYEKTAKQLRFRPRDLVAYLIGQSFSGHVNPSLEHNHFRIAQKADVTVFEGHGKHDFTRLLTGAADPSEALSLDDLHELMFRGSSSQAAFFRDYFGGRIPNQVRIISDGRAALVDPILT